MILQALNRYYERASVHQLKATDATASIAPIGFEQKGIPFVLVVDASGELLQIDDTQTGEGKAKRARSFLVPQGTKKSVNVAANLLWGNAEYVLDIPDPKKLEDKQSKGKEAEYRKRLHEMHEAFAREITRRLGAVTDDPGVAAVLAYLKNINTERLSQERAWPEISGKNPNLTFRLASDTNDTPVFARPAVAMILRADTPLDTASAANGMGLCLVRGTRDTIERLHPAIKGVWGAQTSGANIVSFNLAAFNSYGKEQGANAPIGEQAAFNYTTALNHLLRRNSPNRIQVGDASTVFWASEKSPFEDSFAALFGAGDKDDPDRGAQALRGLFEATQTGVYLPADKDAHFYVLGLAPNAARIAVRFWQEGPVEDFALHIRRHFDDIAIARPDFEKPYLPLYRLLNSTALQNKGESVPPDLAGDTMRAILTGLPYPAMLLQAAIRRCRAEQQVNYPRAAAIKASVNRLIRHRQFNAKELAMSLDRNNMDPGYRLGRLFAALERIQSAAQPGINATIRDRYYGAGSSSPASVFPVLLRLKNHHLAKLGNPGLATWFEKLLGEIIDGLGDFPPQLSLREQGLFAIGYYHQQQDFFAGKSKSGPVTELNKSQGGN